MEDQTTEKFGSCVCKKITVKASKVSNKFGACHCGTCRKQSAGPFFAVDCGTDVTFEGEENISIYNSSDWAERGFCKHCGSNLFYRLKQAGQYFMSPGLFDGSFTFDHQYFIDEKPDYYDFANKTNDMTGPELFAKFSQ